MVGNNMNVIVYAIGGDMNEKIAGVVTDADTANSILQTVENAGGLGVSLHGNYGETVLSGETTFDEARRILNISLS